MIFNHVEIFYWKTLFYTCFKSFWVAENSFLIITKLNKINAKKKAKSILTFDFTTLYRTIPHNLLKLYLKSKTTKIQKLYFTRQTLNDAISLLITKFYFTIANLALKQAIGIPMGIEPPPYWANVSLFFFESKYVQILIHKESKLAYEFHVASRFIDDLCTINDDDAFSSYYKYIYP